MKTIGNIVWFICGGFLAALMWLMSGLICCVTVVGIPLGKQCFKFARLSAAPFGKDISFGGATFKSDVTELDLSGMGLRDISALSSCKELKRLNLSNNEISDLSPLMLLHNNRHPARTPVFQIRKARIHAFRLRGG